MSITFKRGAVIPASDPESWRTKVVLKVHGFKSQTARTAGRASEPIGLALHGSAPECFCSSDQLRWTHRTPSRAVVEEKFANIDPTAGAEESVDRLAVLLNPREAARLCGRADLWWGVFLVDDEGAQSA